MSGWTDIEPSRGAYRGPSRAELWSSREVAWLLAVREIKARYKQTAIGIGWIALQPLAAAAAFTILFEEVADLPSDGIPYAVFVFAGLVVWNYFQSTVDNAATKLVDNRELVTKIYFPRMLVILAAAVPRLVDLAIWLVMLAGALVVYGVTPSLAILTLPVWIALTVAFTVGVSLWLSATHVLFRDVGHAVAFVLQLWLFLSPVAYPSSLADGWVRIVLSLNPVTGLVDGARWALVDGPAPPSQDLLSLLVGVAVVAGGVMYFSRIERRFADII